MVQYSKIAKLASGLILFGLAACSGSSLAEDFDEACLTMLKTNDNMSADEVTELCSCAYQQFDANATEDEIITMTKIFASSTEQEVDEKLELEFGETRYEELGEFVEKCD
ncbi:MAG: hypothetical protein HKN36_01190 [Hellea sp.]|nr:hypothetical protein [Hellea sp.]